MIRADIKESKILSEYANNRNKFIIKAGAIFVQAIRASTSLLNDSFFLYSEKMGIFLRQWHPHEKESSVVTYLAGMKIGATIGLQEF